MHEAGKDLPDMVLVKGVINADGPPVTSICARVESLAFLMGQINQPGNGFVEIGKMVAKGDMKVGNIDIKVPGIDAKDLP